MTIFEVVGHGFNAGSDETDDRVLWVSCQSRCLLDQIISGEPYLTVDQLEFEVNKSDVDFVLPADEGALRDKLRDFVRHSN